MDTIEISGDFIKLEQVLKFKSICASGGEAKTIISDELVKVNGEIETRRGKKIRKGDIIKVEGFDEFQVI